MDEPASSAGQPHRQAPAGRSGPRRRPDPPWRERVRKLRLVLFMLTVVVGLPALGLWLVNLEFGARSLADVADAATLDAGRKLYAVHCAGCHGAALEGEPNWRERKLSGRRPAPPHNDSGHTWHHPDQMLFGITKFGMVPEKYAPSGYQSDMPAFEGTLTDDEIWTVLAYIASRWSPPHRIHQAGVNRRSTRLR